MSEALIPLASALGFTLGCAGIHGLRSHARKVTCVLAAIIMVLLGALNVVWVSRASPDTLDEPVMLAAAGLYDAEWPVAGRIPPRPSTKP